jgi:hypothetical protein
MRLFERYHVESCRRRRGKECKAAAETALIVLMGHCWILISANTHAAKIFIHIQAKHII